MATQPRLHEENLFEPTRKRLANGRFQAMPISTDDILRLHFREKKYPSEIARILGITPDAVRQRIRRVGRKPLPFGGYVRLSATAKKEIVRLYTNGLSLSDVSAKLLIIRGVVERVVKEAGCMRSVGEGVRLAKLGRPRYLLSRKTGKKSADKWKMVQLKVAGNTNRNIAKILKMAQPGVYLTLRKMGLHADPCYSFGEVLNGATLRDLAALSHLTITDLGRKTGIRFATLEPYIAPRRARRVPRARTSMLAAAWRRELFFRLMAGAGWPGRRNGHRYSQAAVIVRFFPNLRKRYSLLLEVLRSLGRVLRDKPGWSQDDLQDYLCKRAICEKKGIERGNLYVRFLPWAPDLMPFLANKFQELRGIHYRELAFNILARYLHTTVPIISQVLNPSQAQKIVPISPTEIGKVIWQRKTPGRKPKPEGATTRSIVRNAVQALIPRFETMLGMPEAKWTKAGYTSAETEEGKRARQSRRPSSLHPNIAACRFAANYPLECGIPTHLDYDTISKYSREA